MWFSFPPHFSVFVVAVDCPLALQLLVLETGIHKNERFLLDSGQDSGNHRICDCRDHLAHPFRFTEGKLRLWGDVPVSLAGEASRAHREFPRLWRAELQQDFSWKVGSPSCSLCWNRRTLSLSGQIP